MRGGQCVGRVSESLKLEESCRRKQEATPDSTFSTGREQNVSKLELSVFPLLQIDFLNEKEEKEAALRRRRTRTE